MRAKTYKTVQDVGHIVSFVSGVAKISGLPHAFLNETLVDPDGRVVAMVLGFDAHAVEAIFFDETFDPNTPVFGTGEAITMQISDAIIGRVLNGLARPLDGFGDLSGTSHLLFRDAPQIIDRQEVTRPLVTGIKIIDAALPIGRGQRELILGDRKVGKSTLALDTILRQRDAATPLYCIYVLCGQRRTQEEEVLALFKNQNALLYTTVVIASAEDSLANQYLAPFVGCAIGEYFRDSGRDALVIYDDLEKHAKTYRAIALLLERSPGREAYPGDIFSLHGALLERAAQLSDSKGGGSLSALPIVETQEGDIASFIPTNIISITDGQIYVEQGLFQKGFLPAINTGLSVSRVGSKAQPRALQEVTKGIRLALAQQKELQKLTQLETVISQEAQKKIYRGELILELLKQEKHVLVSWEEQVVLFYMIEEGFFDTLSKGDWKKFEQLILALLRTRYRYEVMEVIRTGVFDRNVKDAITRVSEDFHNEFLT